MEEVKLVLKHTEENLSWKMYEEEVKLRAEYPQKWLEIVSQFIPLKPRAKTIEGNVKSSKETVGRSYEYQLITDTFQLILPYF